MTVFEELRTLVIDLNHRRRSWMMSIPYQETDPDAICFRAAKLGEELAKALAPVQRAAEVAPNGWIASIWDRSLNPEAHYEITLTVGEIRAALAALAKARGEKKVR